MAELLKVLIWRPLRAVLTGVPPVRGLLRMMGHAGWLPVGLLARLYRFGTYEFRVSDAGLDFGYRGTEGDLVGLMMFWRGAGGYEPETVVRFARWIQGVELFADVGANTGQYTLAALAANPAVRVHAFEGVPRIADRLAENAALNGWSERVTVARNAVCATHGERLRFHVPDVPVPSSASLDPEGFGGLEGQCIEVEGVRLDRVFADEAPGLIKIDVEGFEHVVLEGMTGLFASGARPALILECLPDGPLDAVTELVLAQGYELFHITANGCLPRPRITADEASLLWKNWLALGPDSPLRDQLD